MEETIKTLLEKTNLKEAKKEKILKLDWKNNDLEKFKTIKKKVKQEEDMVIFIKGKENYIHNVNRNIEKWLPEERNIKIVDCYDIEEIAENMDEIMKQYQKILRTTGEKQIEKL